ncbi:hypothetical protein [Saccharopolyspora hattusasensis]|uniref:hypothetical protein n=1 Tax=Saccharopolyspora hattusasensis TaxID=1128679 RepID=UPI003D954174
MPDPITARQQRVAELRAQLGQAAEQKDAWEAERNRLIMELAALGNSNRGIAPHARLSDVGVGKLIQRERASASE